MKRIGVNRFIEYELSTGKVINPYNGIIGINSELRICGGKDSDFYTDKEIENYDLSPPSSGDSEYLTNAECVELADYMVELWEKFKEEKSK